MNPILVLYHRKLEQKLYIANWQNQFETKTKQSISVLFQVVLPI